MSFRTIVIKERCKLDLKANYLVCRNDKEIKIYIAEISTLILETTAISITTALLSELVKHNVKIILCDEKHNPESELVSYYGYYNCVKRINYQMEWTEKIKGEVWAEIIKEKIKQQANFLKSLNLLSEYEKLNSYIEQIEFNDITNREGHSAKVYFNALFGKEFCRRDGVLVNRMLNYGYSILLSCFNRTIVENGYLTQLGIWHKNEFNYFNLASDFMEPFRILIDRIVYNLDDKDKLYKMKILEIVNLNVKIDGKNQNFENAVSIYCQSLFEALNKGDISKIKFYEL